MKVPSPILTLALLLTVCFTLSTSIQPAAEKWSHPRQSGGALEAILGESRASLASFFFTRADVYFHSGYYPSVFEQQNGKPADSHHLSGEHHEGEDEHEHEKEMDFLGQPKNWIDQFGRHFYPSTHSHLDKPGESREILPWLKFSAEIDPGRVETFTLAAYWLRKDLHKVDEAEQFLRQGLRANPDSFEILFELGRIYFEDRHDAGKARNLWEFALRRWNEQKKAGHDVNDSDQLKMLINLALLEESEGRLAKALHYHELELKLTPNPDVVQKQIDEIKSKLAAAPAK